MVEVTVWPELFERTQDYWMEGNIVVLDVRVRERRGRLQVAAQQVELYQPDESGDFQPPAWLTKERGTKEQGTRNEEPAEEPRPQNPEPSAGETSPDPHTSGQQSATSDQRPATSNQSPALRLELRETEDEDADRERLQHLLAALGDYPGDDEVRLTVHTLDGASEQIALPSARDCPELRARLAELLPDAATLASVPPRPVS